MLRDYDKTTILQLHMFEQFKYRTCLVFKWLLYIKLLIAELEKIITKFDQIKK